VTVYLGKNVTTKLQLSALLRQDLINAKSF